MFLLCSLYNIDVCRNYYLSKAYFECVGEVEADAVRAVTNRGTNLSEE